MIIGKNVENVKNIVRIWPRPSPLRDGPEWENFCRIKVLLHVPHRSLQQLTENDTMSWANLYMIHLTEIEADPDDLLGPAIDNLPNNEVNMTENDEQNDLLDEDEVRPDWMYLAEMTPNAIKINFNINLGTHDIDQTYKWTSAAKQYSNIDVVNFVQHASLEYQNTENLIIREVEDHTLNEGQRTVFERIKSHYINQDTKPLNIIIMGTAGTGKSYLIKMICNQLNNIAIERNSKSPILVLGPTGVASYNINGTTIHSSLSIPISGTNLDMEGEKLKSYKKNIKM